MTANLSMTKEAVAGSTYGRQETFTRENGDQTIAMDLVLSRMHLEIYMKVLK